MSDNTKNKELTKTENNGEVPSLLLRLKPDDACFTRFSVNNNSKLNEKTNVVEKTSEDNLEKQVKTILFKGYNFEFAELNDGSLVAKGYGGTYKFLGIGDNIMSNKFMYVRDNENNKIQNVKKIYMSYQIPNLVNYDLVTQFGYHGETAFIISKDSKLMVCGKHVGEEFLAGHVGKFFYVCGEDGKIIGNVENIFSNDYATFIFLTNKKLMAAGFNIYGQLGIDNESEIRQFKIIPGIEDVINITFGPSTIIYHLGNGQKVEKGSVKNNK